MTCIEKVRDFWERSPLWTGESKHQSGSLSFFKEHKRIYYEDCFAGSFDPRFLPLGQDSKSLKILDLGCGTGLLGPEIKKHCSKLTGIDLSKKMLKVAKQKNVYDNLIQSDIVHYLSNMPLDFDYYIALDVFIYVGDLSEIFRLIKLRNNKPGCLVFSTEHTEVNGYNLLKTGRYSHSKTYIESLCKKFDYNISYFSTTDLRKQNNTFLTGGIYLLKFRNKHKEQ